MASLKDLYNYVLQNKIKELENQTLGQKGSSDKLSNLLKDANNLYKVKIKENDELKNKINGLENLNDQLKSKDLRINNLDVQNKIFESGRDEFKKLYELESKKNNELMNELQELKNLKDQEAMVTKILNPNKSNLNKPLFKPSNSPTGNIYKKIDMSIDDKKQSEKSITPATKGFLIQIHKNIIKNLNSEYNDLIIKSKGYN